MIRGRGIQGPEFDGAEYFRSLRMDDVDAPKRKTR